MHYLQGHYSITNLELTLQYIRLMYQNLRGGIKFEFVSKLGNTKKFSKVATVNAYGAISNQ